MELERRVEPGGDREMRTVDLSALIDGMKADLRGAVGEGIGLSLRLEPGLPAVLATPAQLEGIVLDLVRSARDVAMAGGHVDILTERVETSAESEANGTDACSYVRLLVQDAGVNGGADAATAAGPGNELAATGVTVRRLGGWLRVSNGLGAGRTLDVHLPVEPAGAPASEPRSATILLVEDDASVRSLTLRILAREGYHVIEAGNGDDALAAARRADRPIDLLISDVIMPGLSGGELARRLLEERPGTAVLYMSGYPDDTVARSGRIDRDAAFIEKPFTPETLARRVREVLGTMPAGTDRTPEV